jgi:uncharacterized surface protein with fasciclin (FAS1) repeats
MPIGVYAEDTVVDIATGSDDFSILVTALQQEGLVETLQGEGPFTVFAPTNAAFADLLADLDITAEELLAREDLTDILLYHVVSGKVMSTDLSDGLEAETVNGATVVFDLSDGVMVNESTVVTADLEADNGVVHVIDKVLLPPSEEESDLPATVVDIATSSDDFSILVTALQQEGLVETLQGEGPFTVFAPTDAAFADLLAELDITAEELLANEELTNILLYHVVSGKVMSTDLSDGLEAETVNGAKVMFDLSDGVMVNESTVVTADLEADNGVVHVIDKVLLPEAEEEEMPATGVATGMGFIMLASISGLGYIVTKKNR